MNFNDFTTSTLAAAIISILIAITGMFLIARWIYFDAKSRNINPWPWVLVTAFISPNFIGLILYILIRPKSNIVCEKCRNNITHEMSFCPSCGIEIDHNTKLSIPKISNKSLIYGIILFIFSITIILGIGVYVISNTNDFTASSKSSFFKPTYSRSITSLNMNNKWTCNFRALNGCEQGRFKAKSKHPILVYSSEIEGIITFEIYDNDGIIETIPPNTSGEITNLVQGKKYKVIATTDGVAAGRFCFEMK